MRSAYHAFLISWSIPPAATFAIVLSSVVYLRGWWLLRRAGAVFLPGWRAVAFLSGLGWLWIALASPLDVFNGFLLTAHMLQHMILMMVAPPFILLGAPLIPVVRGLPRFAAREFAGPLLNWPVAKRLGTIVTNPAIAWLLMGIAMFAWHIPGFYELALRSSSWHQLEHGCFVFTALLFWWPVVQPWPSRGQWPRWAMIPYLLVADLQNTVLSAILAFSDRVLYPSYSVTPRLFGLSALEDQVAAGAIMWVAGSLAFIVPAVVIVVDCLSKKPSRDSDSSKQKQERWNASRILWGSPPISFARRWRPVRTSDKQFEVISFVALCVTVGLCWAFLVSTSTDSDNLSFRFGQQKGPFALAVFAASGDFSPGPAEFAILVQDRNSRQTLLDAEVEVAAHQGDTRPTLSTTRATHQDSENKLLQSAALNLPTAGKWLLDISVRRGLQSAEVSLPLNVVDAENSISYRWPYFAIFAFFAILVLIYSWRHAPGFDYARRSEHSGKPGDLREHHLPCVVLSGFLVFCDRMVYPVYFSSLRPLGFSALEDQRSASALMWTCATRLFLIAGTIFTARLLWPRFSQEP